MGRQGFLKFLFCAVFTLFFWVFSGLATPSYAQSYSTVDVVAELRYASLDFRSRRMGRVRGALRVRDDRRFSRLELGGQEYPIDLEYFRVGRESRRASGRFELSGDSLRELMQSLNRSLLRKPSVREAVRDLVVRQDQLGTFSESHTVRFASLPQLDFNQPDETIHSVEFFERSTSETLILSLDFAARARRD